MLFTVGCRNVEKESKVPQADENELYLEKILEIEQSTYSDVKLNHQKIISDDVQHILDEKLKGNKIVAINGKEETLKYEDTLFYPVGEKRVYRYFIDGDEKKTVLIDEKGKINSILFDYTRIDIPKKASADEVLEPLKTELSKIFDISFYKNVKHSNVKYNESGFGLYDFVFYNEKSGYMTDYLRISVNDDGFIFGLRENRLNISDFEVNIDKEKENAAIDAKIKDIFTTDNTKLNSWEAASTGAPKITVYNGQLYVKHYIVANYTHTVYGGEISSFINKILIPLDLISE